MKTLWVDLLCFSSILRIIGIRGKIDQICYFNTQKQIKPFIKLMSIVLDIPVKQIDNISESNHQINNRSIYHEIHSRLNTQLSNWVDEALIKHSSKLFADECGFSHIKYEKHLKQSAYTLLYRPIQMKVYAEVFGHSEDVFLLLNQPINDLIVNVFDGCSLYFYSFIFHVTRSIENRKNYIYDGIIYNDYYSGSFVSTAKIILKWIVVCLESFFVKQYQKDKKANIGVEFTQSRITLNMINDIYWLKDSCIDPKSVFAICYRQYDESSLSELKKLNVAIIKIADGRLSSLLEKQYHIVPVDKKYFGVTVGRILKLLPCLFINNLEHWFLRQSVVFYIKVMFWTSIYNALNIKILWTMLETDSDRSIKSQALEIVDSLYAGAHWSNNPYYSILREKGYDVFFPWGRHFVVKNFQKCNYLATFIVGYPSDHYFALYRNSAASIRSKFKGKFILSFQDNTIAGDLPYSENMMLSIIDMLIDILHTNSKVVLLMKPKKKSQFEYIVSKREILGKLISNGRVYVFFGENSGRKYVPAIIGMSSDLVIGLGISTAASECCFAGAVTFHADFTRFTNNDFANTWLNKIVFREVKELKYGITKQINGRGISVNQCKKMHNELDPFQDGQAYKRTGSILKQMQCEFDFGLSRLQVINNIKNRNPI